MSVTLQIKYASTDSKKPFYRVLFTHTNGHEIKYDHFSFQNAFNQYDYILREIKLNVVIK